MGSWPFIIIQTSILIFWIMLSVTAYVQRWDPYPFILLNLPLSLDFFHDKKLDQINRQLCRAYNDFRREKWNA